MDRRNFLLGALAAAFARVPVLGPAVPPVVIRAAGYMEVVIGGLLRKIPFYI